MVVSVLVSLSKQIPEHSKRARTLIKVGDSLKELASLNSSKLSDDFVNIGVGLYNNLLDNLVDAIENFDTESKYEQLKLFQYNGNGVIEYNEYEYEIINLTEVQDVR